MDNESVGNRILWGCVRGCRVRGREEREEGMLLKESQIWDPLRTLLLYPEQPIEAKPQLLLC